MSVEPAAHVPTGVVHCAPDDRLGNFILLASPTASHEQTIIMTGLYKCM